MKNCDESLIPEGSYCYKILSVDKQTGRLNVEKCPYWKFTDHGTIKCEYINLESVNPIHVDERYELAIKHFGSEDKMYEEVGDNLLWDSVKECGINETINIEEID